MDVYFTWLGVDAETADVGGGASVWMELRVKRVTTDIITQLTDSPSLDASF